MAKATTKEANWQRLLPLLIALVAFIGSALGAIYPRWAFPAEETQRRLIESRINAYHDFLKGQAKLQESIQLSEEGKKEAAEKAQQEYSILVKESKFNIAVYGRKEEVIAIANYFRKYLNIPACGGLREKWEDDVRIYQEIRNGVYRNDSSEMVDESSLAVLLFDCHLD